MKPQKNMEDETSEDYGIKEIRIILLYAILMKALSIVESGFMVFLK